MKKLFFFTTILFSFQIALCQTFGNAVNLDGMDDYAIIPHDESLNPGPESWSVLFWLKAADRDQISPMVMKRVPDPPFTQYSFGFGKDDPHDPEPGKKFRFNYIEESGVTERSGHTTNAFIDGNWHHYAIMADKQKDSLFVYVDGNSQETVPLYYYGAWPDVQCTFDLFIATGSSGITIEGPLDELTIWERIFTQNQLQQLMSDTLSPDYYGTPDSGLVLYLKFELLEDLGIGNTGANDFRDYSSYGNHADAYGSPELIPSSILTSVDQHHTFYPFNISPNPAGDVIRIKNTELLIKPATLNIYDLNSRVLFEKRIRNGNDEVLIDVRNLQNGMYLCVLTFEDKKMKRKFIVQK